MYQRLGNDTKKNKKGGKATWLVASRIKIIF